MKQDTLRISEMTQSEIVELAQVCSAMFTASNITDASATAYYYLFKNNFGGMKGQQIISLCSKAAANPPKDGVRFSPSYLSSILRGYEKINQTASTEDRVTTIEERYKYRKEFLDDLYADFEDFKHGVNPKRIRVWQYVAELLVRSGFAEAMPKISEERGKVTGVSDLMNQHEPFVLDCFRLMIKNNENVSQYIHGFEN